MLAKCKCFFSLLTKTWLTHATIVGSEDAHLISPPQGATSATMLKDKELEEFQGATQGLNVADENSDKPLNNNRVAAVADQLGYFSMEERQKPIRKLRKIRKNPTSRGEN